MIPCLFCMNNNPVSSEYCGNCGRKLPGVTEVDNSNPPTEPVLSLRRRKDRRWRAPLLLLLVVLLLLGTGGFVIHAMVNNRPLAPVFTPAARTVPTTIHTQTSISFRQKVAVPSYFDPDVPGWSQMESGVPTAALAIINPDSGPGASADPNYADQVTQAEKAGMIVVGYVSTSYAGTQDRTRTLKTAEQDVNRYYSWYPDVGGIFVDEVSTDCSSYTTYYKPLYDYIKHKGKQALVLLDPGINTSECYMSAGDIIVNFDDTYANYIGWFPDPWVMKYPASRFWQVVTATSLANLSQATALSKHRNAGWIYFTDVVGDGDPFSALPSYWNTELQLASHS